MVLLTARDRSGDTVEALDAGADDCLRKPFDAAELEARLRAGRRILALQEELVAAHEALRQEARRDALTGCLNRGALDELIERECLRAAREGRPLAAVMFDLDHFKKVNDQFGHAGGDAVLREAVSRAQAWVRPYDGLGRYGGEEFIVLLPGCTSGIAAGIAERIRLNLEARPIAFEGWNIAVTASFGVTATDGREVTSPARLLAAADGALYASKHAGRNRVTVAEVPSA